MTESNRTVTATQLQQVAALANLELTPEELPAMERDMNAILGYIEQLSELNVSDVAPMAQVSEVVGAGVGAAIPLRPDTLRPSLERPAVLRCAPETDGSFFKVPKVIER